MNQNKYVFAQLIDFLSYDDFYYIVKKYKGNKGIRNFSCWNQLLMMLFGQLSNCDSMRDLCILTMLITKRRIIWALEKVFHYLLFLVPTPSVIIGFSRN